MTTATIAVSRCCAKLRPTHARASRASSWLVKTGTSVLVTVGGCSSAIGSGRSSSAANHLKNRRDTVEGSNRRISLHLPDVQLQVRATGPVRAQRTRSASSVDRIGLLSVGVLEAGQVNVALCITAPNPAPAITCLKMGRRSSVLVMRQAKRP
jgi:hypothetical protein